MPIGKWASRVTILAMAGSALGAPSHGPAKGYLVITGALRILTTFSSWPVGQRHTSW